MRYNVGMIMVIVFYIYINTIQNFFFSLEKKKKRLIFLKIKKRLNKKKLNGHYSYH